MHLLSVKKVGKEVIDLKNREYCWLCACEIHQARVVTLCDNQNKKIYLKHAEELDKELHKLKQIIGRLKFGTTEKGDINYDRMG